MHCAPASVGADADAADDHISIARKIASIFPSVSFSTFLSSVPSGLPVKSLCFRMFDGDSNDQRGITFLGCPPSVRLSNQHYEHDIPAAL